MISLAGHRAGNGGLPYHPASSILGRDEDVQRIIELLDRDDVRLVTLVGPGGVGKTRLAQEVVTRFGPEFAHGAICVSLSAVLDPAMVPREVARVLGLRERLDVHAPELVAQTLEGAQALLVLDAFEHVAGALVWLLDLLAKAPRLRVLITSHSFLDVAGEQPYSVQPLAGDAEGAAVDLFLERAVEANPSFSPDPASMATIGQICRKLGGLPLAIELAAARIRDLSPARLLEKLEALPEQADATEVVNWCYGLLGPVAQMLLGRLSMFPGGFSEEAVEFVACWPDPPGSSVPLKALHALVDDKLVQQEPGGDPPMFRMSETIRACDGCHHTVDSDGLAPIAFAEYYRSLAARAEEGLTGPGQARWLDILDREYANIRVAIAWLEANDRFHHAIELQSQIQYFISIRGHTVEALERMEAGLDSTMLVPWSPEHGRARLTLGRFYLTTGQFEASVRMLTEAAATFVANGDHRHAAMAKTLLAVDYALMDLPDEVEALATEALELARRLDMHRFVAASLNWLAWHADTLGDLARAAALRQEASAVAMEAGDRWAMSFGLRQRALEAMASGDLEEADRLACDLRDILDELGALQDLPDVWHLLATIADARGDLDAAADRFGMAIALADACGSREMAAAMSVAAAKLAIRRDRPREAASLLAGAIHRPGASGPDRELAGDTLLVYAELAFQAGDGEGAARFLGAAASLDTVPGPDGTAFSTSLRTRLGQTAFDHEFDVGAAWGLDTALENAATWRPPAPTPRNPLIHAPAPYASLSPEEREVLRLMASGMSDREIAEALGVDSQTVYACVSRILSALDVLSRTAAIALAIRGGMES